MRIDGIKIRLRVGGDDLLSIVANIQQAEQDPLAARNAFF
jgi:hypothetical protein